VKKAIEIRRVGFVLYAAEAFTLGNWPKSRAETAVEKCLAVACMEGVKTNLGKGGDNV